MAPSDFKGVWVLVWLQFYSKILPPAATFPFSNRFSLQGCTWGCYIQEDFQYVSDRESTRSEKGEKKKKKKTGQSFESVSDRLGQLSVYINKLEF